MFHVAMPQARFLSWLTILCRQQPPPIDSPGREAERERDAARRRTEWDMLKLSLVTPACVTARVDGDPFARGCGGRPMFGAPSMRRPLL